MEPWEVAARTAVLDVVARYAADVDSGRFDDVVALFVPEGVLVVDGVEHHGHAAIRAVFTEAAGRLGGAGAGTRIAHHTSSHVVTVAGPDRATCYCSFLALVGGHGVDHWGRYLDELVASEGRWRFARRREITDGRVPGGWAAGAATG